MIRKPVRMTILVKYDAHRVLQAMAEGRLELRAPRTSYVTGADGETETVVSGPDQVDFEIVSLVIHKEDQ